jgi:hypothetical protein
MTHTCTACGRDKPLEQFAKWRRQNRRDAWYCDACRTPMFTAASRRRRAKPGGAERDRVVSRRWKDEHREANRARDRRRALERRNACPNCGTLKRRTSAECEGCVIATIAVRRSLIEGMWADGWLLKEIAAALGSSKDSVGVTINSMRAEGWHLPYRRARRTVHA